jgi:hypothetical protein
MKCTVKGKKKHCILEDIAFEAEEAKVPELDVKNKNVLAQFSNPVLSGYKIVSDHNKETCFNYLCTYASPMHNVLDACISITRAIGRWLGPGIREFFGPCEMASSR